jgi:hypothetical protein
VTDALQSCAATYSCQFDDGSSRRALATGAMHNRRFPHSAHDLSSKTVYDRLVGCSPGPAHQYDELVEMGQATELSPFDLRRRVLVKGKVDMFKNPRTLTQRAPKGESNHEAREAVKLKDETGENLTMVEEVVCSITQLPFLPPTTPCVDPLARLRTQTEAYRKIDKSKSSRQAKKTDGVYASCLCLRSLPVKAFMSGDPSRWVLPITSINEDRLLTVMGVVRVECDQIEGLQTKRSTTSGDAEAFGVREERLSSLAIARLASNPPTKVGYLQRRTCGWLLRPYPLGTQREIEPGAAYARCPSHSTFCPLSLGLDPQCRA